MATATFVHEGNAIDYVAGSDTPAGTIVVQSGLLGVATDDIPAGRTGALAIEGVFAMPMPAASFSAGDVVDFDGTTIIAGAGAGIGKVVKDATSGDPTAWVKLTPGAPGA